MKSELQRQKGRNVEITENPLVEEEIYRQQIRPRIVKTGKTQNLNQTSQNKFTDITGKFLSTRVEI